MLISATKHPDDKHNLKLQQLGTAWTEDSSKTIWARRACAVKRPFYIQHVANRNNDRAECFTDENENEHIVSSSTYHRVFYYFFKSAG